MRQSDERRNETNSIGIGVCGQGDWLEKGEMLLKLRRKKGQKGHLGQWLNGKCKEFFCEME